MATDWKSFWSDKVQPHHRSDSEQHYRDYGRELALLTGEVAGKRVLEIGCGSGSMFSSIGFDKAAAYRGVDFSESMLAQFRAAVPGIDVLAGDGSAYKDEGVYDLIFSNTVVQYFDDAMLKRHLENAAAMLAKDGVLVLGSVPWSANRSRFYLGGYVPEQTSLWLRRFAAMTLSKLRPDPVGRWFSLHEIATPARKLGLATEVLGSVFYPYRLHFRLRHA